jgi:hypothetical protein
VPVVEIGDSPVRGGRSRGLFLPGTEWGESGPIDHEWKLLMPRRGWLAVKINLSLHVVEEKRVEQRTG